MKIKCRCDRVLTPVDSTVHTIACECGEEHVMVDCKDKGLIWMHYTESKIVEDKALKPLTLEFNSMQNSAGAALSQCTQLCNRLNEVIDRVNELIKKEVSND